MSACDKYIELNAAIQYSYNSDKYSNEYSKISPFYIKKLTVHLITTLHRFK